MSVGYPAHGPAISNISQSFCFQISLLSSSSTARTRPIQSFPSRSLLVPSVL
ncbi:hypothetical protein M7I_3967 [Glarea lozoyensis 74030]|uniref:Uncharacterized protein n=1 Tax=Glarea lozoyensis (strain ATCC 74030 / MF5533) TaxID=1104152 RepID=H0EMW8_GLAL7|nr:hypothetical protein M7I_3967 [Glarea lozoyensis 74030]